MDLSKHSTAPSPDLPALDRQMLKHAQHWRLDGIYFGCTACGGKQAASLGDQLFVHDIDCLRCGFIDYPWHELACILHWVPSEDVVYI